SINFSASFSISDFSDSSSSLESLAPDELPSLLELLLLSVAFELLLFAEPSFELVKSFSDSVKISTPESLDKLSSELFKPLSSFSILAEDLLSVGLFERLLLESEEPPKLGELSKFELKLLIVLLKSFCCS